MRKTPKNKMKLIVIGLSIIFVLLSTIGCAGAGSKARQDMYKEIDSIVARNDYESALAQMVTAQDAKKPLYDNNNVISGNLDKGLLEHYGGYYRDSSTTLQNAERLMEEAFTKSISQSVATFIANDNSKEYPGEDFEDIYISVFNSLNHFQMGDIDGALVEVRKLTLQSGKLELLSRKYDQGNAKIKEEHGAAINEAQSAEGATQLVTKPVSFSNSALARYLSVLFYQNERDHDATRIELEQLRLAFAQQPDIYNFDIPAAIDNIENTPDDIARLDIISFVGLSPIKEEETLVLLFPIFSDPAYRNPQFTLPKLVDRPNRIDRIEVVVNGENHNLELLENMGSVIVDTFNARYESIFFKTYVRTLVKYTAAAIAAQAAQQKAGNSTGGRLLGAGASLAGRALVDASERADIRMSRYLPNKAYVGSINIEPGTYDITVNYYAGREVVRTETREVEIKATGLNLEEFVNLDFAFAIGEEETL